MPLQMICRFAPGDHGTFGNAVLLQQHYLAEHGDVYVPPRPRTCPDCGMQVGATQLTAHRKAVHGYVPVRRGRPPNVKRLLWRCDLDGRKYGTDSAMRKHFRSDHPDHGGTWRDVATQIGERQPSSKGLATVDHHVQHDPRSPWVVDDIVLPVVEQLASPGGMVPVAHLAAILAWRDATAVMLSAVTVRG